MDGEQLRVKLPRIPCYHGLVAMQIEGGNTTIVIAHGHQFERSVLLSKRVCIRMKKVLLLGFLVLLVAAIPLMLIPYLVQDQATNTTPITQLEQSKILAADKGCIACHSLDGSAGIGPSWMGNYGSLRKFTDGTAQIPDAQYYKKSMLDPAAQVLVGFQNIMLPATLTETEINQFIALMQELTRTMPQ